MFGEPPKSTYEEALKYFLAAEQVEPKFYSQNLLMLGKTYVKLNDKELARQYLTMASEYHALNDEDIAAKQEASKLLNKL